VLSSVFFGIMSAGLLGSVVDGKWAPAFVVTVFLIEWGAGLAALILVWRPDLVAVRPVPVIGAGHRSMRVGRGQRGAMRLLHSLPDCSELSLR
jgi:hypothetical protein